MDKLFIGTLMFGAGILFLFFCSFFVKDWVTARDMRRSLEIVFVFWFFFLMALGFVAAGG